jgi:hypothetical protein
LRQRKNDFPRSGRGGQCDPAAGLLTYNDIYRRLMFVLMIVAPSCLLKRPASGRHIDTAIE